MNIDNISNDEIENMESEIKARRDGYNSKETVEHHGSVENLSNDEMESMESEIKARRNETKQYEQHYGSVENLDDAGIRSMEAQVAEKRKQDIPFKEYFINLINNPEITDNEAFQSAVERSMQSNGVMKKFVEDIGENISSKTFELKSIDKNDKESVERLKKDIEKLIAIYEKYMYTLKENQWDFSNLDSMKLPEDIRENLWQQQKRHDIQFDMPIPADLGEYYGGKYERDGKMVPGIELMYQDLAGKKVNWHQIMNYKENELTPQQRYKQNLINGIKEKREILSNKENELRRLREERQQEGVSYGE